MWLFSKNPLPKTLRKSCARRRRLNRRLRARRLCATIARSAIIALALLLVGVLVWSLIAGPIYAKPRQRVPDAARVRAIADALIAHGYPTGTAWPEVQETCRAIAQQRGWQTDHAPDARVLILIDLGNVHSDKDVLTETNNRLDVK